MYKHLSPKKSVVKKIEESKYPNGILRFSYVGLDNIMNPNFAIYGE